MLESARASVWERPRVCSRGTSQKGNNVANSPSASASQHHRARRDRNTRHRLARVVLETLEARRLLTGVNTSEFLSEYGPHQLAFTFDTDVSQSLSAADIEITNLWNGVQLSAGADYTLGAYQTPANRSLYDVTYVRSPGEPLPTGILNDGDYEAIVSADGVTDAAGVPMAAEYSMKFFFFAGDANLDRSVDADDYSAIDVSYGKPGAFGYSEGDFDYNGVVNADDYSIIDTKWGTQIPLLPTDDQPNRWSPVPPSEPTQ